MTKENLNFQKFCFSSRRICRRKFIKMAATASLLTACAPVKKAPHPPADTPTIPTDTTPPTPSSLTNSYIAYCGYDGCPRCPKYKWSCDGCLASNDGKIALVAIHCTVRTCAKERAVANCAHCEAYACDKLEGLFAKFKKDGYTEIAEKCKATLDKIKKSRIEDAKNRLAGWKSEHANHKYHESPGAPGHL